MYRDEKVGQKERLVWILQNRIILKLAVKMQFHLRKGKNDLKGI